jgi:Transposase DDE domain
VQEYLAALDKAAVEAAETKDVDNDLPPGAPPAPPKVTSLTDLAAAWTNKGQTKVGFAYGTNYLIDTRRAIIVDVEATPARWTAEVAATKTMLERTHDCFGLKPKRLAADAAYGSGLMIGRLMRHQIEPHIPLLDREHQTNGFFTRANFTFDAQANVFVCPGGKQLKSTGLVREDGTVPYFANIKDCRTCALKPRCTKGSKLIVTRNLFEAQREHVRALRGTEALERSARERRKIEMWFAHLKRNLNFRRLRLPGITGASDEFLLAATVQNLKKLVRFMGDRPPIPTAYPA